MTGKLSRGECAGVRIEVDAVDVEEEAVAGAECDVGVGEPDWGRGRGRKMMKGSAGGGMGGYCMSDWSR